MLHTLFIKKKLSTISSSDLSIDEIFSIISSIITTYEKEMPSCTALTLDDLIVKNTSVDRYTAYINSPTKSYSLAIDIFKLASLLTSWCPRILNFPIFTVLTNSPINLNYYKDICSKLNIISNYIKKLKRLTLVDHLIISPTIINIIRDETFTTPILEQLCKEYNFSSELLIKKLILTGNMTHLAKDFLLKIPTKEAFYLLRFCKFSLPTIEKYIYDHLHFDKITTLLSLIKAAKKHVPSLYYKMLIIFRKYKDNMILVEILINFKQFNLLNDLGEGFITRYLNTFSLTKIINMPNEFPQTLYTLYLNKRFEMYPDEVNQLINEFLNHKINRENFDEKLKYTLNFIDKYLYIKDSPTNISYKRALTCINKKYRDYLEEKASFFCNGWRTLFGRSRLQKFEASTQLDSLRNNSRLFNEYTSTTTVTSHGKLREITKRFKK